MVHKATHAAFLVVAAAFVLSACSTPSSTPEFRSDGSTRQVPATVAQAPPTTEAPTTSGQTPGPQPPNVPTGLDKGQRAPAFTVTSLDGRQISDADLQAAGKPYILYFYATW